MSGHNKWSKIKHKKAVTDAKKSKEFTKIVKLLKVEAKQADGNVESPGLKAAIEKAKAANMPKDNIERAIASVSGEGAENLTHVTYETYGPGGVAIIIEAVTDNPNRTGSEIKHLLSKRGFSLANPGSASWGFTQENGAWNPNTTIPIDDSDKEKLSELLLELEDHEDVNDVFTNAS